MKACNKLNWAAGAILLLCSCNTQEPIQTKINEHPTTFCNPLNLNYRFMKIDGGEGIREAADPVVIQFKDLYYLFTSKSSGYWYSSDFNSWTHVVIPDSVLPIEDYAPGLFVHDGYVYYAGSTRGNAMLYRSNKPELGQWEKVKEVPSDWDPAFYVEGDKLYVYHGSSPSDPIYMSVLNLKTLEEEGKPVPCLNSNTKVHGWERPGEQNELTRRPYIEGAWMTEHNGKYYLQYAAPGTEWKTYADGVYVSNSPAGPFVYAANNPVSYKPGGFIGGAGHGCIFQVGETYWKAATNSISVRHMFERRLSFFPTYFDGEGYMYTDTSFGDYPMFLPSGKKGVSNPEWMLLSYRKPVVASSVKEGFPVGNLVDEDARTAWVAQSAQNEWVDIDLKKLCRVNAIQVNYDEYGATQKGLAPNAYQSYVLWASRDGKDWYVIADKSAKKTDTPHDYIEFETPFDARYIKWENKAYTVSDNVSLREIRVFGKGYGPRPEAIQELRVERNADDPCKCKLNWTPVADADGYMIRYGISLDKQYHSYQVTNDSTSLDLNSLEANQKYYFSIAAFNENGVGNYVSYDDKGLNNIH